MYCVNCGSCCDHANEDNDRKTPNSRLFFTYSFKKVSLKYKLKKLYTFNVCN